MKIYQFISDTDIANNGKFSTGICRVPGGYDLFSSIEELKNSFSDEQICVIEQYQNSDGHELALRFFERPYIHFGPGNHKFILVKE